MNFGRVMICWFLAIAPTLTRASLNADQTDSQAGIAFFESEVRPVLVQHCSIGAWSLYGLGTENTNLPGFITINPPADNGGAHNYGSAFLPAIFQGTKIGTNQIPGFYDAFLGIDQEPGPPLKNMDNPRLSLVEQRNQLDLIRDFNARKLQRDSSNPEIEGAIESFELAFRMQSEIPDLLDLSSESESMFKLYGIGAGLRTDRFGRQCLLARRLTFNYAGRDFRLTDVYGRVVNEILA